MTLKGGHWWFVDADGGGCFRQVCCHCWWNQGLCFSITFWNPRMEDYLYTNGRALDEALCLCIWLSRLLNGDSIFIAETAVCQPECSHHLLKGLWAGGVPWKYINIGILDLCSWLKVLEAVGLQCQWRLCSSAGNTMLSAWKTFQKLLAVRCGLPHNVKAFICFLPLIYSGISVNVSCPKLEFLSLALLCMFSTMYIFSYLCP